MPMKTRLLLPAGVLAAAIIGTACVPPPLRPRPPATNPPAAGCASAANGNPGPDSQDPIGGTWGVDGQALTSLILGDVVYVGGAFLNAVSPTGGTVPRHGLAAFCLADGSLVNGFAAHFDGGPVNALATNGANLYVGGNFTTLNGGAADRLVSLNAQSGAVNGGFNVPRIPFNATGPTDGVLALAYAHGVVYAGGDFGMIGDTSQTKVDVGNGAGFDAGTGAYMGWSAGADKKVEALALSPDTGSVFIGGNFDTVQGAAHSKLARLARSNGAVNPVVYNANNLFARVFDLAVAADNQSVFAAIGPKSAAFGNPAPGGSGNRIISFNAAGADTPLPAWNDNHLQGDGQAVELIGGNVYFGFHGGYDDSANLLPGIPNQYRLLGGNASVGETNPAHVSFQPLVNGVLGVNDISQGAGRMVAVGDFTSMGATRTSTVWPSSPDR